MYAAEHYETFANASDDADELLPDEEASWQDDPDIETGAIPPRTPEWFTGSVPLPGFPSGVFPDWLETFVSGVADFTQTPVDLAAMNALAVLATVCQRAVRVVVRPGYRESLSLFLATALPPGERKSAVVSAFTNPLSRWEQEEAALLERDVTRARNLRDIEERRLNILKSRAARAKTEDEMQMVFEEVEELQARLLQTPVPLIPRLLADDVTPQKLAILLQENRGRIAVLSAEAALFERAEKSISLLLKAFSGDDVRIDRITRTTTFVPSPAITLGLALQPDLLSTITGRKGWRGRGLLGRFLFAVPAAMAGTRDTALRQLHPKVLAKYEHNVGRLLDTVAVTDDAGDLVPRELTLSEDAVRQHAKLASQVERAQGPGGELERIPDWASKFPGTVARMAGLLHMADLVDTTGFHMPGGTVEDLPEVTGDAMARAVATYPFFAQHALAVFRMAERDGAPQTDAGYLIETIRRMRKTEVEKQPLWQLTKSYLGRVERLNAALDVLKQRGFLTFIEHPRSGPGRPPAPSYIVNQEVNRDRPNARVA